MCRTRVFKNRNKVRRITLKKYKTFLDYVEKALRILIAVVFSVMLLSMVYLVIMRYIFMNAPSWCEELSRYGFIYLVFLASPIAVRRGVHLQVDFISCHFSPMVHHITSIISNITGVAVLTFLAAMAWKLCCEVTTLSGAMLLPLKYVYFAIPFGCVCMILFCIEIVLGDIQEIVTLVKAKEVKS